MEEVEFGYAPPRQVDENLWEVRGEWKNKLGRRMTVVRLTDGRLILHSSIRLDARDLDWLSSIGTPSFIVAPNRFHCSDAGWMARKFPSAGLYVPASKIAFFRAQDFQPKDVNIQFPSDFANELKCVPVRGTRIEEAAFLHVPSKTLILCDLSFNMGSVFSGFEKLVMKWNKIESQFGPSRLTKLIFTKDRKALLASYSQLLNENFDRVIVNHGEILETGGQLKLRAGVERVFGPV